MGKKGSHKESLLNILSRRTAEAEVVTPSPAKRGRGARASRPAARRGAGAPREVRLPMGTFLAAAAAILVLVVGVSYYVGSLARTPGIVRTTEPGPAKNWAVILANRPDSDEGRRELVSLARELKKRDLLFGRAWMQRDNDRLVLQMGPGQASELDRRLEKVRKVRIRGMRPFGSAWVAPYGK